MQRIPWIIWKPRQHDLPLPTSRMSSRLDMLAARQPYLTPDARIMFLQTCWNLQWDVNTQAEELRLFDSYFNHYEQCCIHLTMSYPSLKNCKHQDFCQAIQMLFQDKRSMCELSIVRELPAAIQHADSAHDCIDFVGSSILMINLSLWNADESLRDLMMRLVASRSTQQDRYQIPRSFNARSFAVKAGIRIVWTRDLLSHLELSSNGRRLALFHHAKLLQLYAQSSHGQVFPDGFLDETARTLCLMLPVADNKCMKWFATQQQKLGLDVAAGNGRHLQATRRNISDFDFWRDRLIVAKDVFDSSQPSGISRFWHDDRNKTQWWTFWIAILVLLLTLVGVIEGALQAYKAYHPSGP